MSLWNTDALPKVPRTSYSSSMCKASKAFKTEILKNAYKKISARNSNLIVNNKRNVGSKNLNFEFLAVIGQFKSKKNANFLFLFFLFNIKKFPWFPYLKTSFTLIFCQTMVELGSFITSCFWGPAYWLYLKHHKTALDFSST